MRALSVYGLLFVIALATAGCHKGAKSGDKLAKGQVIASVNGEDITIYELGAELQGVDLPSGDARKKFEQAALQRIVDRKILAEAAKERKLDKTPDYLMQTRRSDEMLLVNLLQRDVASKLPAPTTEDAEKFMAQNPWMFGQRKTLIIDQIQFPMPDDRKKLMEYQPLKTLDQVEQKLVEDGIDYRRVPTSLDTLQLPPQMVKSILALPPGEVFVVPSGGALTANKIVEVRPTPLTGSEADDVAKEMVRKQQASDKINSEFGAELSKGRKSVTYQAGYEPPAVFKAGANVPIK